MTDGRASASHLVFLINGLSDGVALTFLFEGEVLCEVPTLVVPTQQEQRVGVVDLQRPEVEHTLEAHTANVKY